jgi:hypothetical protein
LFEGGSGGVTRICGRRPEPPCKNFAGDLGGGYCPTDWLRLLGLIASPSSHSDQIVALPQADYHKQKGGRCKPAPRLLVGLLVLDSSDKINLQQWIRYAYVTGEAGLRGSIHAARERRPGLGPPNGMLPSVGLS